MKLTDYVKQVSLEDFGRPFIHHVSGIGVYVRQV